MPGPDNDLAEVASHTVSRVKIDPTQHATELAALGKRWSIVDSELRLSLSGPMTRTGAVAAFAGALADELDHHPKIVLEYAGLTLSINTHDAGNAVTVMDLVFAARLEQWLRANGFPIAT
jgi:4a-hydroxytetrahydrobiopterin dehydratase